VRERTTELAVLKTIGFTGGRLLALVLMQSFLIAALGGGAGLTLAWFVVKRGDPTGGYLPIFYFPTADLIAGLGFVAALGLVTGIVPAMQAMNLRVVDALRRT
jgi:putative ABC transport system permease protein